MNILGFENISSHLKHTPEQLCLCCSAAIIAKQEYILVFGFGAYGLVSAIGISSKTKDQSTFDFLGLT